MTAIVYILPHSGFLSIYCALTFSENLMAKYFFQFRQKIPILGHFLVDFEGFLGIVSPREFIDLLFSFLN